MKKNLQIMLLILFVITLCSEQGSLAKQVLRNSISSITKGQESISSIVKGTVDLISPRPLGRSLRSIYSGNSNVLKARKRIKVKGNFIGNFISLKGLGNIGDGYEFDFRVPGSLYLANRHSFTRRPRSSISISYNSEDSGEIVDKLKIDLFRGRRSKTRQTISGTFSKRTSRGIAKGRFILKLHRDAFLDN